MIVFKHHVSQLVKIWELSILSCQGQVLLFCSAHSEENSNCSLRCLNSIMARFNKEQPNPRPSPALPDKMRYRERCQTHWWRDSPVGLPCPRFYPLSHLIHSCKLLTTTICICSDPSVCMCCFWNIALLWFDQPWGEPQNASCYSSEATQPTLPTYTGPYKPD